MPKSSKTAGKEINETGPKGQLIRGILVVDTFFYQKTDLVGPGHGTGVLCLAHFGRAPLSGRPRAFITKAAITTLVELLCGNLPGRL